MKKLTLFLTLLLPGIAVADASDWAEGSSDKCDDGANREHYNRAAVLPWDNFMGDWRDSKNVAQGDSAYAVVEVPDEDRTQRIEWSVDALVREWLAGNSPTVDSSFARFKVAGLSFLPAGRLKMLLCDPS